MKKLTIPALFLAALLLLTSAITYTAALFAESVIYDGLITDDRPTPSESATARNFTEDTTTNFANPFRGLQVNQTSQRWAAQDATLAGLPTGEVANREYWEDLNTGSGTYAFTTWVDYLSKIRANGQSTNIRFISFEPDSGFDCPTYAANAHGYIFIDGGTPYKVCNWNNSNMRAAFNTFLSAAASFTESAKLQSALKYHPSISDAAIDIPPWGDYAEATYSGSSWTITPSSGGTVDGNQSGAGTQTGLTVTAGHTFIVGDIVQFADGVSGTTVERQLTAQAATSITWASTTAVSVTNLATINRSHRVAGTTANGGAEAPGADTGVPDVPNTAAQQAIIDLYAGNFDQSTFVNTIGDIGSPGQAYALGTKHYGWRGDCWGFRANPADCTSTAGTQHRTTPAGIYPSELSYSNCLDASPAKPYSYLAPAILETCFFMDNQWSAYDIDQSFAFLEQAGISAIQIKNKFTAWASFTNNALYERKLGYRLVPQRITNDAAVTAGNNLTVRVTFVNHGFAKFYGQNYYLMFKLKDHSGSGETFRYVSAIRPGWAPNVPTTETATIPVPTWLDAATYDIYVGIGYNNATGRPADLNRPSIMLATTQPADGTLWYAPSTPTQVVVTNGAPSANPTEDYSLGVTAAGSSHLLWTDGTSTRLDTPATDVTWAARWFITDKTADRPIIAKGSVTSATQSYSLYYKNSNDRIRCAMANGTTVYTVDDTTLGIPSTSTPYCTICEYDDTNHTLKISTNNGTEITGGTPPTGTILTNANNVRIGRDAAGANFNGRIDDVQLWKRKLTSQEKALVCTAAGATTKYRDRPRSLFNLQYIMLEMNESTGARNDSFQHDSYVDTNSPTQAAAF